MENDKNLREEYQQLFERQLLVELTESEQTRMKELKEILFPGDAKCRNLLNQYNIFDIATFFD